MKPHLKPHLERRVLVAITRDGAAQAARVAPRLHENGWELEVWVAARFAGDVQGLPDFPGRVVAYEGPLSEQVAALFAGYEQIIFFVSLGAVVRLIAPHLQSKDEDPGVLVVDNAARFVIPVLSGHVGGANACALELAALLGATPVLTTASDVGGTIPVDILGRELGWRLEAPKLNVTRVSAHVVNGEPIALVQEAGSRNWWTRPGPLPANIHCFERFEVVDLTHYRAVLWITRRPVAAEVWQALAERLVVYRPPPEATEPAKPAEPEEPEEPTELAGLVVPVETGGAAVAAGAVSGVRPDLVAEVAGAQAVSGPVGVGAQVSGVEVSVAGVLAGEVSAGKLSEAETPDAAVVQTTKPVLPPGSGGLAGVPAARSAAGAGEDCTRVAEPGGPVYVTLGVGCDRGTALATLQTAVEQALALAGLGLEAVQALASIEAKRDEAGLLALAHQHRWPLRFFSVEALAAVTVPNPSEVVRRHMGTPAVAEAAALLAAGAGLEDLLLEKHRYRGEDGRNATVSIARNRAEQGR